MSSSFSNIQHLVAAALGIAGVVWLSEPADALLNQPLKRCTTDAECAAPKKCLPTLPPGTSGCFDAIAPPPPSLLGQALSLGRPAAAADIAWLRTLQYIGSPYSAALQYDGIEHWVTFIQDLRPDLSDAALFAGSMLSTLPRRAEEAERILARADNSDMTPESDKKFISFWRAAAAYYGRLDAGAAADFYEEAYRRGGGDLMRDRAKTLRANERTCAQLGQDFRSTLSSSEQQSGVRLTAGQSNNSLGEILYNCFKHRIEQSLGAATVATGRQEWTIPELLDEGFLKAPPTAPPGKAWVIDGHQAKLVTLAEENAP